MREWIQFNFAEGWGTDQFEDNVSKDYKFPERWQKVEDRYHARSIIDENLTLIDKINAARKKLLRVGYRLGDVIVKKADANGINFRVQFKNGMEGHSTPTGFDAERIVFLRVTVTDKNGKVVFKSGDFDPNGDLRNSHSAYVHDGKLPEDKYLFSLKARFMVRMIKGGEREQVLPVAYSLDSLPFIRPSPQANVLLGRPTDSRKHRQVLAPLHSKWPNYRVNRLELAGSEGPYTANLKIMAGMVPANLVHEIEHVGFDYGMSPREVADKVVAGYVTVWDRDVILKPGRIQQENNPLNNPPPEN